ncbi:MAG: acyltransferase [Lachnospiraceae bacterium]|nr:acyltransferase [Lachnospiraceae bacterium]
MNGLLCALVRIFEKILGVLRSFFVRYCNEGTVLVKGRLRVKKNVSVEVRKGGELQTGAGTVTFQGGTRIVVENGGKLMIGDDVGINSNCYIACHNSIEIGNNTIFGPGVVVVDQDHDYKAEGGLKAEKYKIGRVKIGKNVWVGANVVILRDTVIEDNAVIAAGSLVKGRVLSGKIYREKREGFGQ